MATRFKIEGLPPFDGEYPLDVSFFTNRELHTIKRISDVRAGQIEEAFAQGDNDLIVAFAVIALERAGKQVGKGGEDLLWDAEVGKVVLVADEEADAGPPEPTTSELESKPDASKNENGNSSKNDLSESPESVLSPTGSPPLPTGLGSNLGT